MPDDVEDMGLVKEPIQKRRGHHGVAHHLDHGEGGLAFLDPQPEGARRGHTAETDRPREEKPFVQYSKF